MFDITNARFATRSQLEQQSKDLREGVESGDILTPDTTQQAAVNAGGINFFPNSDISFSTTAATVAGTLPADAGDGNQEAWRMYWIEAGAPVVIDAAHALKAVGHSLYAGNEAVNPGIPIWDRVNGWISMGAAGVQQYDLVVQLRRKVVGPGEKWFLVFRARALTNDLLPAGFESAGGLWQKSAAYEGFAKGDPFDITYLIEGAAGAHSINYRALAETDSGFSILSNILNVPNANAALSVNNYVKLFYGAGPGFLKFTIYKEDPPATFARVHEVRNSTDLQFNDIGAAGIAEVGWPAEPNDRPLAYAQTKDMFVGPFGGAFLQNKMGVLIPGSYASQLTYNDGQFVRISLLQPTTVNRQIALDKFFFGTTFNAWAPDPDIVFADRSVAIPSVSPASGSPGAGGVDNPPGTGGGGGVCVVTNTPVMIKRKRRMMIAFKKTLRTDGIEGDLPIPYQMLRKRKGTAAEYYLIKTKNGIRYPCNARHRLTLNAENRQFIEARQVTIGTKLAGKTIRGRRFLTPVVWIKLIPKPVEVGTYELRDLSGEVGDGHGMYVAGFSKKNDRGLFSSNHKGIGGLES